MLHPSELSVRLDLLETQMMVLQKQVAENSSMIEKLYRNLEKVIDVINELVETVG